jgi:hypothetical protein
MAVNAIVSIFIVSLLGTSSRGLCNSIAAYSKENTGFCRELLALLVLYIPRSARLRSHIRVAHTPHIMRYLRPASQMRRAAAPRDDLFPMHASSAADCIERSSGTEHR